MAATLHLDRDMKLFGWLALVLIGVALHAVVARTRDAPTPAPPSLAATTQIEALSEHATGARDDLSRAIAIAARQDLAWRDAGGPRALANYAEAEEAIGALGRWIESHGALPPARHMLTVYQLAKLAIGTATAPAPAGIATGAEVGYRLVTEGRGLFDARLGLGLLRTAFDRADELHVPRATAWIPPRTALVRILAAEALNVRDAPRPEGSDPGRRAALYQYWSDVLGQAVAEPHAATLERLERGTLPDGMEHLPATIVQTARELEALQAR